MLDIPQLMAGHQKSSQLTNFSRGEVHQIYTLYKTLHQVTSQRYRLGEYEINDGLDFHVYQSGLYQIFMQSQELSKRIFNTIDYNYSGKPRRARNALLAQYQAQLLTQCQAQLLTQYQALARAQVPMLARGSQSHDAWRIRSRVPPGASRLSLLRHDCELT